MPDEMAASHATAVSPPLGTRLRAHPLRAITLALAAVLVALAAVYAGVSYYAVATISTDYPRASVERAPDVAGASYEVVSFRATDGVTLRGWLFRVAADRVVVLVHGRDDDRTWAGKFERMAEDLIAAGYSVLMFDLRGHGSSDGGKRYTMGSFERRDVAGAVDFLVARGFPERGVALLGISMGGATAIEALRLRPDIGPVIVESAYSDFQTLIAEDLPLHYGLPAAFAPGIALAARVQLGIDPDLMRPIDVVRASPQRAFFFIQCADDDYVLAHHATDLRSASANASSALWLVPGCGHVDASQQYPGEYLDRVLDFLAREFARAT